MNRNSRTTTNMLLLAAAVIVLTGLIWVNIQFSRDNPGGNDFLVHYIGTRSYLLDRISPYSDEVALRIQTSAYGRAAEGIEHELRVAYPFYSIFLFAPFSLISDYAIARALWMVVLEVALIIMCLLSFQLLDWKPKLWMQSVFLAFSVLWYHSARSVINGNAVILITLMLIGALLALKRQQDHIAGLLLAIATIKPHLVILLIPYILFWSIYRKRWRVLSSFSLTLGVLLVISLLLMPDWLLQNIWEILKYPDYNPAGTLAAALGEWFPELANQLRWGILIVLSIILFGEWIRSRRSKFPRFLWVAMLTLVIGQWIGIQTDPGNFILLFPALMMIIASACRKWPQYQSGIILTSLGVVLFGLWGLFVFTIQWTYQPVQSPVMFLPLPALCLTGLYWIKWWVAGGASAISLEEI